jgi:D-erythronate 2-dehydrogenase
MNVVLTGGAGFLGSHVARELLGAGTLCDSSGVRRTLRTLTVVDLVAPRQTWASDPRVRVVIGDLADNALIQKIITADCDSVFHFAAILKADADRDARAAVRFNVLGMVSLLEHCRSLGRKPKFFFASSTGVYENGIGVAGDETRHLPTSTYGAHKAIGELLVNDFTRTGAIDGRGLRFPVVMVRPNRKDTAVSNSISAIVRDPLLGLDIACPFEPALRMPVTSVENAAKATRLMHDLPAERFTHGRTVNLPSLVVTIGEIAEAVTRRGTDRHVGHISWKREASAMGMFAGRPEGIDGKWASMNGISHDRDIDAIIDNFLASAPAPAAAGSGSTAR